MVILARVAPRAEPVFAESERNLVERGRPRRRGPAHSEGARLTDEEPRHHADADRKSDSADGQRRTATAASTTASTVKPKCAMILGAGPLSPKLRMAITRPSRPT